MSSQAPVPDPRRLSPRRGHDHAGADMTDRRLVAAIVINGLLTVAQIAGGLVAGSLALVADALHNLNDAGSLAVALVARRIARRPADAQRTFGYGRAQVVGALINQTALLLVGIYLIYQAVIHFIEMRPVSGWIVVWVASFALVVDAATALLTWSGSKGDMNVRATFIHHLVDAMASLGTIVAGMLILLFDWRWADPLATLLIAAYALFQAVKMLRGAVHLVMESVPVDVDFDAMVRAMEGVGGVTGIHHVHAWHVDEHRYAMEAHVITDSPDPDRNETIKRHVKSVLAESFGITHSTLEFEYEHAEEPCRDAPRAQAERAAGKSKAGDGDC